MILDKEKARDIVWEEDGDFEVIKDEVVDSSRWSVVHEIIVKEKATGKFFFSSYSVGATEMQDERPYEYGEAEFVEVRPVEKTVISYEPV